MSVHVTRMVTLLSGAILWKGYYESLQSIAIENKNKWVFLNLACTSFRHNLSIEEVLK